MFLLVFDPDLRDVKHVPHVSAEVTECGLSIGDDWVWLAGRPGQMLYRLR
ncbi:hypothetical protein BH10ACT3_BH10ACT3_02850 [soil metagenome]